MSVDPADQLIRTNFKSEAAGGQLSIAVWLRDSGLTLLRRATRFTSNHFYNVFTKGPLLVAVVLVGIILIRGLFAHVVVIQSISVPKMMIEDGYTPDVASGRLRDAIAALIKGANSHMSSPEIALHGDLPDVVVPSVGISLDAVTSALRTLLRSTRSKAITGEFTTVDNQLWLRLRLDGREVYEGAGKPDDLFQAAAQAVIWEIQPYYVAAFLKSTHHPTQALEKANKIIDRFPVTNENVVWAYVLKASIFREMKKYAESKDASNTILRINPKAAGAHINLGNVLVDEGNLPQAIDQFRKAIDIEPRYALAHHNLGVALDMQGNRDDAMYQYSEAIRDDSDYADPHVRLGFDLARQRQFTDAIREYRAALAIDPDNVLAHKELGVALNATGEKEQAIEQFQATLRINPNDQTALKYLNQLGVQDASAM